MGAGFRSAAAADSEQPNSSRCSGRTAIRVQSIVQGLFPDARPWMVSVNCLLFISVAMHSCACSDSRSAIASGRTYEDSVTRRRMIQWATNPGQQPQVLCFFGQHIYRSLQAALNGPGTRPNSPVGVKPATTPSAASRRPRPARWSKTSGNCRSRTHGTMARISTCILPVVGH